MYRSGGRLFGFPLISRILEDYGGSRKAQSQRKKYVGAQQRLDEMEFTLNNQPGNQISPCQQE